MPRIIVVGAGITGLVAARELARVPDLDVTVLESSSRPGGQIRTEDLDGARVDVGAEAVHLGAPHVAALVRELGLDSSVVGAAPGGSVMATRKGLRPLPAGVGPTGPTRIWPVLRSGILTLPGLVRAGLEPLMARRAVTGDTSVGAFTTGRFGREVTQTFVDPLLGNLHGGDVDQLSLRSTAPQLVGDARDRVSLLLKNLRRKPTGRPGAAQPSALPMFATWPGGLATFTDALAAELGDRLQLEAPVAAVHRAGDGWEVELAGGERLAAAHLLLTTPAPVTAELLRPHCPEAAAALEAVPMVSVATVVLGYDPSSAAGNQVLREHNGLLLPSTRVRTFKAATNLSRKWPALGAAHHLLRASVGRAGSSLADELDDEQITTRVADELGELTGLAARPQLRQVFRWPDAMPQLVVGHQERVAGLRRALDELGGIDVAGCGVDGLGISSTVRSGQQAARSIISKINQSEES
ncbi:protoporphyrinogen oxidase [Luteococcus peritonei]|uniref:Coproporphyrinogen III oxidase n=1 Tax=Luteococcus peritonei TaxID=88874 RepID=A0ABW4RZ14_9ACTN